MTMVNDETANMISSVMNMVMLMGVLPIINKVFGALGGGSSTQSGLFGLCGNQESSSNNNNSNTNNNNNNSSNNNNNNSNNDSNNTPIIPNDVQYWESFKSKIEEFKQNNEMSPKDAAGIFQVTYKRELGQPEDWEYSDSELSQLKQMYSAGIQQYGLSSYESYRKEGWNPLDYPRALYLLGINPSLLNIWQTPMPGPFEA